MRTGHRGVENWTKVVDSFTSTVDTLYNNAMKELKLNARLLALVALQSCLRVSATLFAFSQGLLRFNCSFVLCANLMGTSPRDDKCILHHFGRRGEDRQSAFRVCMYTSYLDIIWSYCAGMSMYLHVSACIMHVSACIGSYFVGI